MFIDKQSVEFYNCSFWWCINSLGVFFLKWLLNSTEWVLSKQLFVWSSKNHSCDLHSIENQWDTFKVLLCFLKSHQGWGFQGCLNTNSAALDYSITLRWVSCFLCGEGNARICLWQFVLQIWRHCLSLLVTLAPVWCSKGICGCSAFSVRAWFCDRWYGQGCRTEYWKTWMVLYGKRENHFRNITESW